MSQTKKVKEDHFEILQGHLFHRKVRAQCARRRKPAFGHLCLAHHSQQRHNIGRHDDYDDSDGDDDDGYDDGGDDDNGQLGVTSLCA